MRGGSDAARNAASWLWIAAMEEKMRYTAKTLAVLTVGALVVFGVGQAGAAPPSAGGGPKKIQNCRTITEPGSYILTNNLPGTLGLLPSGDCIVIEASNVTLDLSGFVISGEGQSGPQTGILNDIAFSNTNITIRNGTVTRFITGISLANSSLARVENMRVWFNSEDAIDAGDAEGARIIGNTVTSNGRDGIRAGVASLVADNVVGTNRVGIFVKRGSTVIGNTSRANTDRGIGAAIGSTLVNNTTAENNLVGIGVVCPSLVVQNAAYDNGYSDLLLDDASGSGSGTGPCMTANNVAPVVMTE